MDVFMMRFQRGAPAPLDLDQVLAGIQPFLDGPVRDEVCKITTVPDGGADLHGVARDTTSLMWSNVTGGGWDILVRVADATGAVIVAVGRPPCITHAEMRWQLPEGLREDARVVTSGSELLQAIR